MEKDYEGCSFSPDGKHLWDLLNLVFKKGIQTEEMDKMIVFCKHCLMTAERSFK